MAEESHAGTTFTANKGVGVASTPDQTVARLGLFLGPELSSNDTGAFTGPILATNLGQAFQGSNPVWFNIMQRLVQDKDKSFWTRYILPQLPLTQHHITVALRVPGRAINGLMPYEGTARMITSTVFTRTQSAHRRGVSARMEGDFFVHGRDATKEWAMKVEQVRWSIQETLNYLVAYELSISRSAYRDKLVKSGRLQNDSLDQVLTQETMFYGAAQKGPMTLGNVVAYATEAMQTMDGDAPDTIILPQSMTHLLGVTKLVPVPIAVPKITDAGITMDNTVGISAAQFNGLNVLFTETIVSEEGRPPFQPFGNVAYNGQYYLMGDAMARKSHAGWRSEYFNTWIHDETKDDYAKVRFESAVVDSMRWAEDGSLSSSNMPTAEWIAAYEARDDSRSTVPKACGVRYCHDVFHSRYEAVGGQWYTARAFGDLCPSHHLPDALLDNCAETYVNGLAASGYNPGEAEGIVSALRNLVDDSDSSVASNEYYLELRNANASRFKQRAAGAERTTADDADRSTHGLPAGVSMRIPSKHVVDADHTTEFGEVPPGISTWMALRALAGNKGNKESNLRKHAAVAAAGVLFVDAVASHVAAVTGDAGATRAAIVDAWVPRWQLDLLDNDPLEPLRAAVFNMLIGAPRPPVYLNIPIRGAQPATTPNDGLAPWMRTSIALAANMLTLPEKNAIIAGDDLAAAGELLGPVYDLVAVTPGIAAALAGSPPRAMTLALFTRAAAGSDRFNGIAQAALSALTPDELAQGDDCHLYNLALRMCYGRLGEDPLPARMADLAGAVQRVVGLLRVLNLSQYAPAFNYPLTPAGVSELAERAGLRASIVVGADTGNVAIDPVAVAAAITAARDFPADGPTADQMRVLFDAAQAPAALTLLQHVFGDQAAVDGSAALPTLKRWLVAANLAYSADRRPAGAFKKYLVPVADPIPMVEPGTWVRTIFGMSKGLVDYLDGVGRHRVAIIVAPSDPDTGYTSPLLMPSTATSDRLRASRSLRTGARIEIDTRARERDPYTVRDTRAAPAPAGYGANTIAESGSWGSVAAMRIRQLFVDHTPRLTPLRRMFATVLCMTRVHRDNILKMLEHHAMPPLSAVLQRPFIQMNNVGAWIGRAGVSLGATFYGQENVKTSWDAQRLTVLMTVAYHALPMIWRPQNMMVIRNMLTTSRAENFGMDMCETSDHVDNKSHSIIAKLGSYYDTQVEASPETEMKQLPSLISAAGSYGQIDGWDEEKSMEKQHYRRPHLSSDAVYSQILKVYYTTAPATPAAVHGFQGSTPVPHLCYRGEQYIPDSPNTCQTWIPNAGPLGLTGSMPGSAEVRQGGRLYYASDHIHREGLTP
jgi:hypothetical protein